MNLQFVVCWWTLLASKAERVGRARDVINSPKISWGNIKIFSLALVLPVRGEGYATEREYLLSTELSSLLLWRRSTFLPTNLLIANRDERAFASNTRRVIWQRLSVIDNSAMEGRKLVAEKRSKRAISHFSLSLASANKSLCTSWTSVRNWAHNEEKLKTKPLCRCYF